MEHELKIVSPHFNEQFCGRKTFEIRDASDRDFICDDTLLLREWDPQTNSYTGRWVRVYVTHMLREYPALSPNYVVMSTERRERFSDSKGLEKFNYTTEISSEQTIHTIYYLQT